MRSTPDPSDRTSTPAGARTVPSGALDCTCVTVPVTKPDAASAWIAAARLCSATGGSARSPVVRALMFPAASVSVKENVRGSPEMIAPSFVSNCVGSNEFVSTPST